MVSQGCDIESRDVAGETVLHDAVKTSTAEVVACLLDLGAKATPEIMGATTNVAVIALLSRQAKP